MINCFSYSWYNKNITRAEAENLLKKEVLICYYIMFVFYKALGIKLLAFSMMLLTQCALRLAMLAAARWHLQNACALAYECMSLTRKKMLHNQNVDFGCELPAERT